MDTKSFDKRSTNICKGIAIILMYIHHSFYSTDSWGNATVIFSPFSESWMLLFAKICKVCVAVFVFLSAYGVYRSSKYKSMAFSDHYIPTVTRRYTTLLYNFFFIFILAQLFAPLLGRSRIDVYGKPILTRSFNMIIDALGLAHAFDTPTFNSTWWYMSLAYLLIIILPILVLAADKIGFYLYPLSILLPLLSDMNMESNVFRYLPAAVLGILCAKYGIFEKLHTNLSGKRIFHWLSFPASILLIAVLAYCRYKLKHIYLFDGLIAMAICVFCYLYLEAIPVLNNILAFLGKHSMNMFLIHTFIRGTSSPLHKFSYAPRYPVLIILLLLVDTVLLSMAIEGLKKITKKVLPFK